MTAKQVIFTVTRMPRSCAAVEAGRLRRAVETGDSKGDLLHVHTKVSDSHAIAKDMTLARGQAFVPRAGPVWQ